MKFNAACLQLTSNNSPKDNLYQVIDLSEKVISEGADIILTPENTFLFTLDQNELLEKSEDYADGHCIKETIKFVKSKKNGFKNEIKKGYVISSRQNNKKNINYTFSKISVGATETAILNSCLSNNKTKINNIALEPEVIDLISFLKKAGAKINFNKKRSLTIQGVKNLKGIKYKIMPDRIEAGTYLVAAAITNSVLTINNIVPKHLENILKVLMKFGVQFKINKKNDLKISPKIRKPINVTTAPYPGFPTDMQAQIMSLLVLTKGTSNIKEDIFENRFLHVSELNRMGANIKIENNKAKIIGTNVLSGAEVMATDLRASVCLVLAGLVARGETIINRVYHLERGYENLVKKLKKCGAKIKIINA